MAINLDSYDVLAVELTQSHVHNSHIIDKLLSDLMQIGKIYADGAYSYKQSFDAIANKGEACLIKKIHSSSEVLRNQLVKNIWAASG